MDLVEGGGDMTRREEGVSGGGGGVVSLDNMFLWLCFMMYFGPYLMYIVYWLNVGHAE